MQLALKLSLEVVHVGKYNADRRLTNQCWS